MLEANGEEMVARLTIPTVDALIESIEDEASCACMTYDHPSGVEDVAAYGIDCHIHGWRWDYVGPALTLEDCAARDDEARS